MERGESGKGEGGGTSSKYITRLGDGTFRLFCSSPVNQRCSAGITRYAWSEKRGKQLQQLIGLAGLCRWRKDQPSSLCTVTSDVAEMTTSTNSKKPSHGTRTTDVAVVITVDASRKVKGNHRLEV